MGDFIEDPLGLLAAAAAWSARALLEPDVERLCAEALRTRQPAKLKAARVALGMVVQEHRDARRELPPRMVDLQREVWRALADQRRAAQVPPPKCSHCGQTMPKGAR
jgi:hypothetical protein